MFIKSWLGLVHNWYKPHLLHTHGGEPRWIKPRSLPLGQTGYFNLLHNCVHISFHFIFFFVWYFFVPCGRFGSHNLGKAQQPQEQRYPFLSACTVFWCVRALAWLPVFGILNVCTDFDACNCAWGLCRHCKRVCTESRLWEKSSLPHQGLEPVSVLRLAFQSGALPTELSCPIVESMGVFVVAKLDWFGIWLSCCMQINLQLAVANSPPTPVMFGQLLYS